MDLVDDHGAQLLDLLGFAPPLVPSSKKRSADEPAADDRPYQKMHSVPSRSALALRLLAYGHLWAHGGLPEMARTDVIAAIRIGETSPAHADGHVCHRQDAFIPLPAGSPPGP